MLQLNSRVLGSVLGSCGALRTAWEVLRSCCVDHFVYAWVAATVAAAAHGRSGAAVEPWGYAGSRSGAWVERCGPFGAAGALGGDHLGVYGGHLGVYGGHLEVYVLRRCRGGAEAVLRRRWGGAEVVLRRC